MRRMLFWLIALASPVLAHAEMVPDAVVPATEAEIETLNTGEGSGNRLTVPVMINGQGPFQFIVDTGSDRSVISRELAARLNLPQSGTAKLISVGGTDSVQLVKIDSLAISAKSKISDVRAPTLPERYLGADGLLGIDSLKKHRVVLDFLQQTITLEPANNRNIRKERDPVGTIVVTAKSRLGQLVLVDADANGKGISVIVDTGSQNSLGNPSMKRLVSNSEGSESLRTVNLLTVVGDRITAEYSLVGRMRIGGLQLGNAAVAFADAHHFKVFGFQKNPAMMLGMEGLRAFRRVSIDFANRKVKFLLPQSDIGS